MIPEVREKLEIRIKQTEMKIATIYNKYGANQAMDIKDIEDYKHKIKKQSQLRNKTMKAVKEHFALEDIELIKTNLIENTLIDDNTVIEADIERSAKIIVKKEKPTETFVNNRPRPLFKDSYERYEWHLKNGCTSVDDRRWFEEYIKSEEYKSIYE